MIDTLLISQIVITACLAGWMITGVMDNWLHPRLNMDAVAMVTRFNRMAEDYPEDYAVLAHRRVENENRIRLLFYGLVVWETVAAIGLAAGTVLLIGALFGLTDIGIARSIATLGCLAFTMNWAAFLIGGNYFAYWYCHAQAQTTHFLLAIWGTFAVLLLQAAE